MLLDGWINQTTLKAQPGQDSGKLTLNDVEAGRLRFAHDTDVRARRRVYGAKLAKKLCGVSSELFGTNDL